LASKIPSELVLPESDGPFANLNGKPIMPWEAMDICSDLSKIWNISISQSKKQMMRNFEKLNVGLPQ